MIFLSAKDPDVAAALRSCRLHVYCSVAFSILAHVLMFALPIYMINVFTRVLNSQSIETLIVLFIGFAIAIGFKAVFDSIISALSRRMSLRIDRKLSARLAGALFTIRASGNTITGAQVFRDLEAYRRFLTGSGMPALLDGPWAGLFLAVLWILDPLVGTVALIAAIILSAGEIAKYALTRASLERSNRSSVGTFVSLDLYLQNAEAVVGQGMLQRILSRWMSGHRESLGTHSRFARLSSGLNAALGAGNQLFLGLVIAVAAYQIVMGNAPAAILFAAMILFRFALQPVQRVITAYSEYIPVKQGLERIEEALSAVPAPQEKMQVPRPDGVLTVKGLTYVPPNTRRPILRNINFGVEAGRSLGIVGLSGSGKTTLARLITGCVKPSAGNVRLDGNDVWEWAQTGTRWYIGYLPQSVQLLPGSVADNISHFGEFDEEAVTDAAILAGAHDMILRLPEGYDTVVGAGGFALSGGQRQLIGLARAVAGNPAMVVLDEPNASLDGPGEGALMNCIASLGEAGTTVVMISHRPNLVNQLDKTVLLKEGEMVAFGETEEVYARLGRPVLVKRKDAESA